MLLDSEQLWNEAKQDVVLDRGGRWRDDAPRAMMGMSSHEWAAYMHDELGVPLGVDEIDAEVVARMEAFYRERLPLLPAAVEAVRALAGRWRLGLASSSNREIIDLALSLAGVEDAFAVTVSSEEVARGKPAPDVYLEACRRLDVPAAASVAVEDSSNGLRSASAAGMSVIAVPNPHYPPDADALTLAAVVIESLDELTPELVEMAYERGEASRDH